MAHVSSDATIIERIRSSHELELTLATRRQQAMDRHCQGPGGRLPAGQSPGQIPETQIYDFSWDAWFTVTDAWRPDDPHVIFYQPKTGKARAYVRPPTRVV